MRDLSFFLAGVMIDCQASYLQEVPPGHREKNVEENGFVLKQWFSSQKCLDTSGHFPWGQINDKLTCSICGLHFHNSANKTRHMRIHYNDRKFACICGASFYRSDHLKAHRMRCKRL